MIKVVSCFWNAGKYIEFCINSLMNQKDKDFEVYFIDDMSEDNSSDIIKKLTGFDPRFHLIKNTEKKYKLKNLDELISTFKDEDIIIELDGDDFLLSNETISDIKNVYNDGNIWLTNGSFIFSNGSPGFSLKGNPKTIRRDVFRFSHLRTWKVFLWKSIPKKYFTDEDGSYFKSAADAAYCIPLLELSGEKHYRFLERKYYVYNGDSPYNDHKPKSASGGFEEQERCVRIIRSFPKLNELNL